MGGADNGGGGGATAGLRRKRVGGVGVLVEPSDGAWCLLNVCSAAANCVSTLTIQAKIYSPTEDCTTTPPLPPPSPPPLPLLRQWHHLVIQSSHGKSSTEAVA